RLHRPALVVFLLCSPGTTLTLRGRSRVQGPRATSSQSSRGGAMNEESVFAAALEKASATERQTYLDEVCRGDPGLRQRVEQLLPANERVQGILDCGLDSAAMTAPPSALPLASDRLFDDRFKLRQKLG